MGWRWLAWAMAALVLAACNPLARDPQVDREVRSVFDQLRHHRDAELLARLDPTIRAGAISQLPAVQAYVPAGEPRGRKVIGTNTMRMAGKGDTVATTDEYDYGDRTVQVDVRLYRPVGRPAWQVQGFHVQAATAAQLAVNRFTLAGKSALQYLFLAFTVASPLLMVAALVKVVRTPGLRRKWLWGVLAFAGLASLHMNWTTGQLTYQLVSIQLIGAGAVRSLSAFSPWILSATLPVGAILILTGVWANPRRARKAAAQAASPSSAG